MPPAPIYMDRKELEVEILGKGHKRILLVIFIPSVERDGNTKVDQEYWVREAMELLGRVFGGATAYPKATGVWRDDERNNVLVFDEPIVLHCYTTPDDIENESNLSELARFCRRMGREANQGEIAAR